MFLPSNSIAPGCLERSMMPKGPKPEVEAREIIGSSLPIVLDPAIVDKFKATVISDRLYDS